MLTVLLSTLHTTLFTTSMSTHNLYNTVGTYLHWWDKPRVPETLSQGEQMEMNHFGRPATQGWYWRYHFGPYLCECNPEPPCFVGVLNAHAR